MEVRVLFGSLSKALRSSSGARSRVALADKVHNARSIVRDDRAEGHALWYRFTNKRIDDQLWYYRALLHFFSTRQNGPLVEDLWHAVAELEQLADADPAAKETRPSVA